MLSTQTDLILLACSSINSKELKKSNELISTSNWTIYDLKMSQAEVLYHEFVNLATNHITDSPKLYTHLLSEGHIILRIAKEMILNANLHTNSNDTPITFEIRDEINKLYIESCIKLADACLLSPNKDEYCLAYPYYSMSQSTINDVYERVITLINKNDNEKSINGSVHTLKSMIIKTTENNEELGRRLTQCYATNLTFGDKLLEFFAKYSPNEISVIALNSTVFRDLMSTKMCEILLKIKSESKL